MEPELYIFNGSGKITEGMALSAVGEIANLRPVKVEHVNKKQAEEFLDSYVKGSFNPQRNQVNGNVLLEKLSRLSFMQEGDFALGGKIILIDEDLYDEGTNWMFGAFAPTPLGLGYLILSTRRLQNGIHARDYLIHELGHMFGAPSKDRTNIYESLGTHCSNHLCVMKQSLTIEEAVIYSHKRYRVSAPPFCSQCKEDIKNFIIRA